MTKRQKERNALHFNKKSLSLSNSLSLSLSPFIYLSLSFYLSHYLFVLCYTTLRSPIKICIKWFVTWKGNLVLSFLWLSFSFMLKQAVQKMDCTSFFLFYRLQMYVSMFGYMYVSLFEYMYVCMYAHMYGNCIYVSMCICCASKK